mgnify:FL=1
MVAKKKAPKKASSNILAFVGTDEARLKEAALNCFGKLVSPEEAEFGAEVIDGVAENAEAAVKVISQTIGALQTLPFFGGEKVVWLKGATIFADSQTGKALSVLDASESLTNVLEEGLSDGITFILSAPSIDKRRSFYKKISKLAKVEIFDRPDMSRDGWQDQIKMHVRNLAKDRGLFFEDEALELFVMLAGTDFAQIGNELEKIDLFLSNEDRTITTEHVSEQVALTRAGVVFELGNNIARKNLSGALRIIDHLLYQGENAIRILLAAVVPTVRRLLIAKDLAKHHGIRGSGNYRSYEASLSRLPASETAHLPRKKDGGLSVYPIFLASSESKNFSLDDLRQGLADCLQANRALVTSALDHRIVLERLVIRLLAGSK